MSHSPMVEHEGVFGAAETRKYVCRKCKQETATCRVWESSCGGYEDYKYECQAAGCGHAWWVEGIDS